MADIIKFSKDDYWYSKIFKLLTEMYLEFDIDEQIITEVINEFKEKYLPLIDNNLNMDISYKDIDGLSNRQQIEIERAIKKTIKKTEKFFQSIIYEILFGHLFSNRILLKLLKENNKNDGG